VKLRTAFRAGVWLRRLRASNADIRDAVADAAAEALRNEVERTAGIAPVIENVGHRRLVGSASAEDAAREFGTLEQTATPWLAPVLPLAREPMRAAALSAAARAVSPQRKK